MPTLLRSYEDLARHYKEEIGTDLSTVAHPIPGLGEFAIGFEEMPMVQIFTRSTIVQVYTSGHREKQAIELARRAAGRLGEAAAR